MSVNIWKYPPPPHNRQLIAAFDTDDTDTVMQKMKEIEPDNKLMWVSEGDALYILVAGKSYKYLVEYDEDINL